MSFPGASNRGIRARDSATRNFTSVSPNIKVQTAWKSVKSNFKARTSISMPDLKRWLPYPRASESDSTREDIRSEDKEPSLFCESLLTLMQQTGRFDYLDYSKDTSEKRTEDIEGTSTQKEKEAKKERYSYRRRSLKRFSWSR